MKVKLDEHQLKAVKHFEGPALVVAGPGSGKTTIIIERIMNLIHEHNVDPTQILAIAFTNPAADEMNDRINKRLLDHKKPKICTLHRFGKELITAHYELLEFNEEPEPWNAKHIAKIVSDEKELLKRETQSVDVAIYKFEGRMTKRVYIGQSINPSHREKEHRIKSSNKGLRDALKYGDEIFDFKPFDCVKGANAYSREQYWIQHYKNKSAVNLVQGMETVAQKSSDINVDIYKLKSLKDYSRAYFGYTTELGAIREKFNRERTSNIVFDEVLYTDIPWSEASIFLAKEIRKHKDWAVFNREDPINARYRNQLHIEIFCEHFKVSYEEVLEKPENFENLYEKYDNLKNVSNIKY